MRSTLIYYTVAAAEVAITTTTTISTTTAVDMTTSNAAVVWVSFLIAALVSFSLSYIIYCLLDKNNNNSYNNVYNITILLWFIYFFVSKIFQD